MEIKKIIRRFLSRKREATSGFSRFNLTWDDIEKLEKDFSSQVKRNAKILVEFHHSEEDSKREAAEYIFGLYLKVGEKIFSLLGSVPYYDKKDLVKRMLDRAEFPETENEFFPFPVYVSAGDEATVGILVYDNGKFEVFEGNDEASEETYDLVQKMTATETKKVVQVWGMHTEDLVRKISEERLIPKGIYVSPSRQHAEGHWELERNRVLFRAKIDSDCIREESHLDWKIRKDCPVLEFKIF